MEDFVAPASTWERAFDRLRRIAGCVAAPIVFLSVWHAPLEGLTVPAHRLAAIIATVIVLWVTEVLPMAVTAMLGAAACIICQVAPDKEVIAPFADPLMFLFVGSFMLARAVFLHGLDRRVAFAVLSLKWVGARPGRILFAFGATTAFISAWISNTATTAMMFAIGLSILRFLFDQEKQGGPRIDRRFATALMLITSFSASVGGLATPIGSPPNIIGIGQIRALNKGLEVPDPRFEVTFFEWSFVGTPVVIVLYLFMFAYLWRLCPAGVKEFTGSAELLHREKERLGPWTTGQLSTAVAFGLTVLLWITPGIVALVFGESSPQFKALKASLPEAVPALLGAGLLFVLPGGEGRRVLTWNEAVQIDWGVILLYGGGFALGVLANQTKLADWVGQHCTQLLPISGTMTLVILSTIVATLVSEATSNTASANIVVPVVVSVAIKSGVDPLAPALAATLASSLGFMLPVSTPCNAIVYGSGLIPLTRMIAYGFLLDIAGIITIITLVSLLVPLLSSLGT